MTRKKKPPSKARRLHRFLGAGAAVFLIFMVLSGVAINHSNGLGLDQRHTSQAFLLDWYGLGAPQQINSIATGKDWLSFAGSQVYLNDRLIANLANGVGAVFTGDMLIVASIDELLLLDRTGNLIERLPWQTPAAASIESIGLLEDHTVVVKSENQLWLADAELLGWQPSKNTVLKPQWSVSQATPEALRLAITRQYRGEGPSLERVLLDFHSGRIFGPMGILIYDLLALAVLSLSISGLVIWLRSRRKGMPKRKQKDKNV